jgi:hypothetical protein
MIARMVRITRSKVLEKITQYWPDVDPQEVMNFLDEYGVESHEQERARVQLAILKLSEGERARLEELVGIAKREFRDVLAYAEYPEEMSIGFIGVRQLSSTEVKALRDRDKEQYLQWLEG